MTSRRVAHVRHPILRLDVIGPDGSERPLHRVFCRHREQAVELETCAACTYCDAITGGPEPTADCTIVVDESKLDEDAQGVRTAVGTVLRRSSILLDRHTMVSDAVRVLRNARRRSVTIVDEHAVVVGIVHEATFVAGRVRGRRNVASVMSSAVTIHEATPVRRALQILAGAHLREATVVDDANVPLGVFADVEGLRWLARQKQSR